MSEEKEKIIHCEDCKHYRPGTLFECSKHMACILNPKFNCADGEPKDGEQNDRVD